MIVANSQLDKFYIGEEELKNLPSVRCGIPDDIVFGNICFGCKVIAECGIRLEVSQGSIVAG